MKGAGMFFVYDMLIGNPNCVPALEENTKKYNWMNRVRVIYKNGKIVLDLSYLEANLYTFITYVFTIIFSYFSYKYIEIKFYKK